MVASVCVLAFDAPGMRGQHVQPCSCIASLLQWRDEILQDEFGGKSRRNGSIIIKNNSMQPVRRYNFLQAWPVTWEGPSLSANGSELAIEMIELAHHGITVS